MDIGTYQNHPRVKYQIESTISITAVHKVLVKNYTRNLIYLHYRVSQ
jgi:hypothetical protein